MGAPRHRLSDFSRDFRTAMCEGCGEVVGTYTEKRKGITRWVCAEAKKANNRRQYAVQRLAETGVEPVPRAYQSARIARLEAHVQHLEEMVLRLAREVVESRRR